MITLQPAEQENRNLSNCEAMHREFYKDDKEIQTIC